MLGETRRCGRVLTLQETRSHEPSAEARGQKNTKRIWTHTSEKGYMKILDAQAAS